MASIRLPNIDQLGNFLNPDVVARLIERFGVRAGEGEPAITANMTLDQAAVLETQNGA